MTEPETRTKAQVVIEEAPLPAPADTSRPVQVLTLSAKSAAALDRATSDLASHLARHTGVTFADVAYTLHRGRTTFPHRIAVVAANAEEFTRALERSDPRRVLTVVESQKGRAVAFLFSGQGSQYVGMGRGVYESERTFRDEVDECAAMLAPVLGFDIRDVLYPEPAAVDAARAHLSTTAATQPALFVVLLLGSGDHELLISVHHIVADGWSVGIINRELRVLYDAFVAGRPSPLPEPPIQYGDFACRQREWLVGEVFESERRYWLERLHARPAPLELQTDFPRPRQRPLAGARAARARRRHVRISGRQRGAGFQEGQAFKLGPVDFTLRHGELVFLVGGNGSGKSTFVKVLTGLYSPQMGAIRLDGQAVSDKNREWYCRHFSAVFSDFYLFDSLLGLGDPDLDARAGRYLIELELDAKVQISGGALSTTALSQGQRKRLALLTAFLEDRPIYVFDGWAADQDPHYREIFYKRLLPELKARGKSIVVISHDDRYYQLGDRIVKLDYGLIATEARPASIETA